MAHKTFISYKYSEARGLRDKILKALGKDAQYYQGETSESPNLKDTSTENIKRVLKNMIYDTSVTIVIISPNMTKSDWIEWEIQYSLKEITREDKTSHCNGVVGVVMKYKGGYSWLRTKTEKPDGHTSTSTDESKLFPVMAENRGNQCPKDYFCNKCKTINALTGSYISLVEEETFLETPKKYIDNAFEKSRNINNYTIKKQV